MTEQNFSSEDRKWMRQTLKLARKGAGYVSPNPMVGCIIVSSEGRLIGQGYHETYGEAHAETNAVQSVQHRQELAQATVYVNLEPCAHHGKTPPCCEMLAKLPIKRVVVAMEDPNPKTNGSGIVHLRDHGITVDVGLLKEEAEQLNEFFIHFQQFQTPFVTLKIAQTVDGYIAAPDGESQWITGPEARERVHVWRSQYDAVLVGRVTARLDNPRLTVRHVEGRQPHRVVIDGPYALPRHLHLFSDQYEEKTIVITHNKEKASDDADPMLNILQSDYFRGQTLLVPKVDGHCDLHQMLRELGKHGITSLLVEAGQQLASALIRADLVDKIELFSAPKLLGGGTKSVVSAGINRMADLRKFRQFNWEQVGDDMLLTAYR